MFPPPDGWTTADLVYIWKEVDPVQIVKDLNLPRFKLEQFQVSCDWPAGRGSPLIGPDDLLQHDHQHRGVQLPQGGAGVQAGVLLLPPHHLRALLHARHRVLGQLLAGQQVRTVIGGELVT